MPDNEPTAQNLPDSTTTPATPVPTVPPAAGVAEATLTATVPALDAVTEPVTTAAVEEAEETVAPTAIPAPKVPEIPAYEFLGHLPDSYGTMKLFLVPRDPNLLFAYWDLTPAQYQEAARQAHDGKVFLEVYVPGEGRVQQLHIWDSHKNWYLQVNRPDTSFVAQLGYYRPDNGFQVLARSSEVRTPRESLSGNTEASFVTIPFTVSFKELSDLVISQQLPGEALVDTLVRLQTQKFELPFQARIPKDLTPQESEELLEYLGEEEVRRRMVGSFEITEILRKRFEAALSSGQWVTSAGAWVVGPQHGITSLSSLSSPFGASFGKERGFRMHVNAELIIYGGTEPNAKVRIDGKDITLSPDGTFAYHFVFPDGQYHIPVDATSADGVESRSALLSFLRMTETQGDVRKTGQPPLPEPLGRMD